MKVTCSYYTNSKRLGLVLSKLSEARDVQIYPVRGTLVRTPKSVKPLGQNVEYLVFSMQGGTPLLLTSNSEYAMYHQKVVEYDATYRDNIYVQALNLCKDKFDTSSNVFEMVCAIRGSSVVATAEKGQEVLYTIRTPLGEVLTSSEDVPKMLYTQCTAIKSFQYEVVTDACERSVEIKKGQPEIFKEIAHYLNKALVFTKVMDDQVAVEYCISGTGCAEVRCRKTKNGIVSQVYKVPFTKVKVDPECTLYAMDCSLDVVLRSSSFGQALRGGESVAQD